MLKFLPILPEIMPVFTRNYASTCLPILLIKEEIVLNMNKNRSNDHCTVT